MAGLTVDVRFDGISHQGDPFYGHPQLQFIHGSKRSTLIGGLTGGYGENMTDYPDWQTAASTQSGNVFTSFAQTLTPGNHAGPVTPVYSWSSLNLEVIPTAGACKVTVTHWADAAGTQKIGSDTWDCNASTILTVRVPLRGPYAQLSLNVTSAGNLTASTWGVFQTYQADRVSFPIGGQIIFEATNTLAASASKTYTMQQYCAGRANWCFIPFDNSGMLGTYVQAVDELGNIICRISSMGNPTGIDQLVIECPDAIIQVIVQNTDGAAAHSYGFSFIVPPQ